MMRLARRKTGGGQGQEEAEEERRGEEVGVGVCLRWWIRRRGRNNVKFYAYRRYDDEGHYGPRQ